MSSEGWHCRVLGHDDRTAVSDISGGIYTCTHGAWRLRDVLMRAAAHDYLPAQYPLWVDAPNRTILGVFKEGEGAASELVAVEVLTLLDGAETILLQALRVAPSARGQGWSKRMYAASHEYIEERRSRGMQYERVRTLRITTPEHNYRSINLYRSVGFTQTERYGLLSFSMHGWPGAGDGETDRSDVERWCRAALLSDSDVDVVRGGVDDVLEHADLSDFLAVNGTGGRREPSSRSKYLLLDWTAYRAGERAMHEAATEVSILRNARFMVLRERATRSAVVFAVACEVTRVSGNETYFMIYDSQAENAQPLKQRFVRYAFTLGLSEAFENESSYVCFNYLPSAADAIASVRTEMEKEGGRTLDDSNSGFEFGVTALIVLERELEAKNV